MRHCAVFTRFIGLAVSAFALAQAGGAHADVYVGVGQDGQPVFANFAHDASFKLLYRDPVHPAPAVAPAAAPRESAVARRSREALEPLIVAAAARHGLDAALLRAVMHVESRFNPQAVSPAGAVGVMQLMPATGRRFGVTDRTNAAQNIEAGARYLAELLARFDGNTVLALSAYNAGEGAVEKHARRVPPYRETLTYVPQVLASAQAYGAVAPVAD